MVFADSPQLSFSIEQYQHLPNPYPRDAIRDSFLRTNIVNLDLASPPPHLCRPPLTPPETPLTRKTSVDNSNQSEFQVTQLAFLEIFLSVGLVVDVKNRPTRYLAVGGVPPDAHNSLLSRVFCVRPISCRAIDLSETFIANRGPQRHVCALPAQRCRRSLMARHSTCQQSSHSYPV